MESSISNCCKTISSFLTHVESSSKALADSIQRRPIPLGLASSSFLGRLDARISSTASDLAQLEAMAFGTVSFEELIGHCDQIYKMNRGYVSEAEDRLKCFGYVPKTMLGDDEGICAQTPRNQEAESEVVASQSVLLEEKIARKVDFDDLFGESMSLQNIGLSDACLATIASEGKHDALDPKLLSASSVRSLDGGTRLPLLHISDSDEEVSCLIMISQNDYDKLPSYMKNLASFEELSEAVAKLNPVLKKRAEGNFNCSFNQQDLELLGLGRKGKTYVLMLLKMNRLESETVGESVFYNVLQE